jgi:hypothetical protein
LDVFERLKTRLNQPVAAPAWWIAFAASVAGGGVLINQSAPRAVVWLYWGAWAVIAAVYKARQDRKKPPRI